MYMNQYEKTRYEFVRKSLNSFRSEFGLGSTNEALLATLFEKIYDDAFDIGRTAGIGVGELTKLQELRKAGKLKEQS